MEALWGGWRFSRTICVMTLLRDFFTAKPTHSCAVFTLWVYIPTHLPFLNLCSHWTTTPRKLLEEFTCSLLSTWSLKKTQLGQTLYSSFTVSTTHTFWTQNHIGGCCMVPCKFKGTAMAIIYDRWHWPQYQYDILELTIIQQTSYYICARAIRQYWHSPSGLGPSVSMPILYSVPFCNTRAKYCRFSSHGNLCNTQAKSLLPLTRIYT